MNRSDIDVLLVSLKVEILMNEREARSCTPQTITEDLIDLCKNNGVQNPFYVSRQPKSDCEEGDCFKNVKKYVARLGGLILVGWAITSGKNLYLECEAHAIWQSPDGENIDITPSNENFDKTLFSYQSGMQPVKTPSKYIPFTQSTLVAGSSRLLKNDIPLPNTQLNQTPSLSSTQFIDCTEEDKPTTPSSSEVNGCNSPLASKSPVASSGSSKDLKETASGILGKLIINNQSVNIYNCIDEETLKNGPGWMPEGALPGEDGMSVILGHRNRNHLKIIEDMQAGDEIDFRYLDGRSISYSVTDVQIFKNSADWVLPQPNGNMLVIITCYPFRYSGSAPGKFQVLCRLKI